MTTIYTIPRGGRAADRDETGERNPLAVYLPEDEGTLLTQPPVAGRSVYRRATVPGIATGAAYAAGDVVGTAIEFPNMFRPGRHSGILLGGIYYDLDDEGLAVDLHLLSRNIISPGADNAAFNPTDPELLAIRATLTFPITPTNSFFNLGSGQVAYDWRTQMVFSDSTSIWGFMIAQGALNIAAENLPRFAICVLPD